MTTQSLFDRCRFCQSPVYDASRGLFCKDCLTEMDAIELRAEHQHAADDTHRLQQLSLIGKVWEVLRFAWICFDRRWPATSWHIWTSHVRSVFGKEEGQYELPY